MQAHGQDVTVLIMPQAKKPSKPAAPTMYNLVWDITIGSGDMPETFDKVAQELADDLGRELTAQEHYDAEEAWRRCYQEFHQP